MEVEKADLWEWLQNKNIQIILQPFGSLEVKGKTIHPTQKPIALMEYLIKTYTNEGETVLDNTFGSCSTGIACLNTNRKFIGIELHPAIHLQFLIYFDEKKFIGLN